MTRWHVKKVARIGLGFLSWASGWLWLRERFGQRPCVRVLTYHRFRSAARDPFSLSAAAFARQIAWLAERRLAVSLDDVVGFLEGRRNLPRGAVLVTIDDGYADLWSAALPTLERYRVPAVAFIPVADMGCVRSEADRRLSLQEVASLAEHGVAVGSHSRDHRSLGRMTSDQVALQVGHSRAELERLTGRPVIAFAYPFGTRRDFSVTTRQALQDAGYRCAFTSQHGAVTRGRDALELPRIKIEGGDPFWLFKLALRGGLDGWHLIDRLAVSLQQTEKGYPLKALALPQGSEAGRAPHSHA